MKIDQLHEALAGLVRGPSWRQRRLLGGPQGAHVELDGKPCLSFASNDYLGLANHPALRAAAARALREAGLGAGASHLLAGHHVLHDRAEIELARFVEMPAALLFSTGYMANLAVVTSLLGRGDALFADKSNHASLVDAALLCRAEHHRYRHADIDHLEDLLKHSGAGNKMIVSDAVFSMEGDIAPAEKLLDLAQRYHAWLYLDDAHGFGVLGANGQGSLAHQGFGEKARGYPGLVYMATLGKAAGVAGAFVSASSDVIDWLVNKARTYIYTTAMPPALAAAVMESVRVIRDEPWRHDALRENIRAFRSGCDGLRMRLSASDTPIQALILTRDDKALQVSDLLLARGVYVPAIRPPTVPPGTSRLRISLTAAHQLSDVRQLVANLHDIFDA